MNITTCHRLGLATLCALAAMACGDGRDVHVTGTVAGAGTLADGQALHVTFYEPELSEASSDTAPDGGTQAAATPAKTGAYILVDDVDLGQESLLDETVSIVHDELYAVAFVDANGDGKCSDGEAWGDALTPVASDDTATLSLQVAPQQKCPSIELAE